MLKPSSFLTAVLVIVIFSLIITGIILEGPGKAIKDFIYLQYQSGRLLNDFIQLSSIGGTLINAALVGTVGLIIILILKVQLSGPTYAAIFTLVGFGFFGKTPLNIFPILLGVYLSAKFVGKHFRDYIIIALFGTALGPLVSFMIFETGMTGLTALLTGLLSGILAGFLLPAIAVSMLHLHQGYNLYNMGLSCGFFALFFTSLVRATGFSIKSSFNWYTQDSAVLTFLIPVLSVFLIISALVSKGLKSFRDFLEIQKLPGRLPSDFMDLSSMEGSFINSGMIGLAGFLYVYFVNGDFNGPVLGGLLTIMGFGAFGTHLKNSWPVVLGVVLSSLLFSKDLSSPGPLLAAIFCTTLAPMAGQFGVVAGILAGFIHLFMVLQTGSWQGGINLYNNGFAGGITATFIVAVIQWYKINKTEIL